MLQVPNTSMISLTLQEKDRQLANQSKEMQLVDNYIIQEIKHLIFHGTWVDKVSDNDELCAIKEAIAMEHQCNGGV